MYSNLIEIADETLSANRRVCQQAADLQARTVAIMLQCRRHRLPLFSGASDVNQGEDRMCVVCRSPINSGAGRFRLGNSEFHPECFKSWLTAPLARPYDPLE
jgi:hypothetical protein